MIDLNGGPAIPHPDGAPLLVNIKCYSDAQYRRHRTHPIVLHPDWSVDTGHDLEAEQFTVAFGGFVSCMELPERVIPAVRAYVQRQLRHEFPDVILGIGGRWTAAKRVERCCAGSTSFPDAQAVAAHVRNPRHIASEFGVRAAMVVDVGKAVFAVHDVGDPVELTQEARDLVGRYVQRARDAVQLWEAGLHPRLVREVHDEVGSGQPLTAGFYLGVLSKRPDLLWVHDSAAKAPDRDVHEWLAWTETHADRVAPGLRGDWLRLGVSRRDITLLTETAYRPEDVRLLASSLRMTPTAAAAILVNWAGADCFPPVAQLVQVSRMSDLGADGVNATTVNRLHELLDGQQIKGSREQLAFALTLCGAPRLAAHIIKAVGSLEPSDIARGLREWESARQQGARVGKDSVVA